MLIPRNILHLRRLFNTLFIQTTVTRCGLVGFRAGQLQVNNAECCHLVLSMTDVAGQFGRVLYAELESPRDSLSEHVAVKTMKCLYTQNFTALRRNRLCSFNVYLYTVILIFTYRLSSAVLKTPMITAARWRRSVIDDSTFQWAFSHIAYFFSPPYTVKTALLAYTPNNLIDQIWRKGVPFGTLVQTF